MTLFTATLLTGVTLLLTGGILIWNGEQVSTLAHGLPRSRRFTVLAFGLGTLWFLWKVSNLGEADFGNYRTLLLIAFAVIALLSYFFVPDFLAVRGVCIVALLASGELLDAAFSLYDTPARLFLVVFAYLLICLSMYLAVVPYRVRDFFHWLFQTPGRPKLIGGLVMLYGLILSIAAFSYYSYNMELPPQDPTLLMILAGPTGIGKSTLCRRLVQTHQSVRRVVTATTRPPRQGEENGKDYYFLSRDDFQRRLDAGAFFESAVVHGHQYGTLRKEILPEHNRGCDLIMNVDVQGVRAFQLAVPDDPLLEKKLVTIFLMPPSLAVIRNRLRGRGETEEAVIQKRLETAKGEIPLWSTCDFCLVSGTKDEDFEKVEAIWKSEKLRVSRLV